MPKRRPNILWIFSDQHRAQAMSCAGDPNLETPALDRLAAEGIRFTRAYSNTPLCSPFRASLYTGQYMHSHGVTSLHRPLLPAPPQLAEVLRQNGYFTSHMGKWHLSGGDVVQPYVSPYFRPGWERWLGWEASNRFFHTLYAEGDMPWKEDVSERALPGYQTDALTDLTLDFLRTYDGDRPWFHVMSFEPPHSPNVAPEPYMRLFRDRPFTLRPNFDAAHPRAAFYLEALRGYYAQIKNLDDNLGRLLDALEATGQRERTLVWYFSDHGDYMGSHGRWQKCGPHEESAGIPLIVSQPGTIPAGGTAEGLIAGVDFMPSLLGHLNLDIPATCQGEDLSRMFADPRAAGSDAVLLGYESASVRFQPEMAYRALRWDRYLYTYYYNHPGGEYELYDLAADPYQRRNVLDSPDLTTVRIALRERLARKLEAVHDPFLDRCAAAQRGH